MDAFNILTGAIDLAPDDDSPPDTGELVRAAIVSTKSAVGIAEYPDSDKIGVWADGGSTHYMLRRAGQLDYRDGER